MINTAQPRGFAPFKEDLEALYFPIQPYVKAVIKSSKFKNKFSTDNIYWTVIVFWMNRILYIFPMRQFI
jgi:hypothetical protein